MKILVISGSPHKNGTSATLVDQFIKGAEMSRHEVSRFDAAFKEVHPCIACEKCHEGDSGCVFDDDMAELNPLLLSADAVVFAAPIYYYGMCSQIRTVIDRFYANDAALHTEKKTALLLTMADGKFESAKGAVAAFENMANFLGWKIAGKIVAMNCVDTNALQSSPYPDQAYRLGMGI